MSSPQAGTVVAAKARKRACDSCYRRKIHCDGAKPSCNWCNHHGLACTFVRPMRKQAKRASKGNKRDEQKKSLAGRIERLEELLSRTVQGLGPEDAVASPSSGSPASTASTGDIGHESARLRPRHGSTTGGASLRPEQVLSPTSTSGTSFGKLHFAGYHLGDISSFNGVPLFSSTGRKWIRERTGDDPAFSSLDVPLWQNQQLAYDAFVSPLSSIELPPIKVVEIYFQIFKTTTFPFVFPLVDRELFQETIDLAYRDSQRPQSADIVNAKACVLAFTALLNLFEGRIEDAPVDGELCAVQAQHLMPQILLEANFSNLQVCLMLDLYHLFSGRMQSASMYHSLACRIMSTLGAHTGCHTKHSRLEPEDRNSRARRVQIHVRKLFWICYTLDKDMSLRTGQPPSIDDDYCDTTLPPDYDKIEASRWEIDPSLTDDTLMHHLPGDPRLSLIKAKTGKLLYSAKALQKSDAELLRDIRGLDDELESWRLSIRPEYRPKLSPSGDWQLASDMSPPKRMHVIIHHFEYFYLMDTIHRATSRCKAWAHGQAGEMEGVSSSLELSVQASRSTLLYLRVAVHVLLGESFWMVLFYPMSAVLTIFCNILLKPHDAQAKQDLELLASTPELVKQMRTRRLTPNETIHMKLVEDFINELIRLGSCAIKKAGYAPQ